MTTGSGSGPVLEERLVTLEDAVVRLGQLVEHLYTRLGVQVPQEGDSRDGPAEDAQLRALLDAGDLIGAIKAYRRLTGLGLVEAKQAVEAMR